MVDFQTKVRTIRLADSEDRALLGSNPSAAVGDGDIDRSNCQTAAPVPNFLPVVLVRKAINPSFVTTQLWIKLNSLTRPVCHLAISLELGLVCDRFSYKHSAPPELTRLVVA